jgi:hypothetical protein
MAAMFSFNGKVGVTFSGMIFIHLNVVKDRYAHRFMDLVIP